eukprot:2319009-Amphidinium_carterae.1
MSTCAYGCRVGDWTDVVISFSECGDMHLAGHIAGTAGWEFRWYPFAQRGISHDGVAIHTLRNTHDLAAQYVEYHRQRRREIDEAAELGLLRPPHVLNDDNRDGIHEALQQVRRMLTGIARDAASVANSETETIEEDDDKRDTSSME